MRHTRFDIDGTWHFFFTITDHEFKNNSLKQLQHLMIAKAGMLYFQAKDDFKKEKKKGK